MSATTFETWFRAQHPAIPLAGALSTLKLAKEGASVPFLARYRKEQTGSLDEVALQNVLDAKERFDHILARQKFIVEQLERQKQLTPELQERLLATFDPDVLEDLYLPFKQKRKTKAALAREAGLQPLADWIWNCAHGTDRPLEGQTLELWAYTFRNPEKGCAEVAAVLQGAQDILTERLAEVPELRKGTRDVVFRRGCLRSAKGEKAKAPSKYERYFDYIEAIQALSKPEHSHRYMAVRRGAAEGELALVVCGPKDDPQFEQRLAEPFLAAAASVKDSPGAELLEAAARAALKAYVLPAIDTEVHRELKRVADEAAIKVFSENLRNLLLASPFGAKAVLGVDPGVRTGCKLALVDDSGRHLADEVLQLNTEEGRKRALDLLKALLEKLPIQATAVGNGTAGRETESFLRQALRELGRDAPVVMVSEAGASVYSASAVAREEFPDLDVTVRGAISIARRLQDPLAELVKVEPKSIGVGQYQHDVAGGALKKSLDQVVDSCVNQVGVNLNTASRHLLAHVSGLGPALAKAVVEHRAEKGLFRTRQELMQVPRFSRKAFEQAAGFLRIPGGQHPLDNTGVHPERYAAIEGLARKLNKDVQELLGPGVETVKQAEELKQELGAFTFADVVQELEKPGRDPRDGFVPFAYRDDVHALKDLKPGMTCPGIVTNVTNFGAFVDIGVHQDGLVHVSQVSDRFVKDPREVVRPGMRVEVRVLEVNLAKSQIALTMKQATARPAAKPKGPKAARPARPPRAERPPQRPQDASARQGRRPPPRHKPENPRPQAPKTAAPSPERRPGPPPAARPPQPRGHERRQERSSPPQRGNHVPLNNPFAVLADLKKQLKSR